MAKGLIPEATAQRPCLYLRCLEKLKEAGRRVVSSSDFSNDFQITDARVRNDLAHFGALGREG